jgi:hypothetical protein
MGLLYFCPTFRENRDYLNTGIDLSPVNMTVKGMDGCEEWLGSVSTF